MRHKNRGRKFGRHSHQREALGRHTVVNLIRQFGDEKKPFILTTQAKAKEFSAVAEKFITMAKKAHECVKEAAELSGLSEEEVRKGWSGAIRERRELRRVAKLKKRAAFRKEPEPKVETKDVFAKDPEMRAATGRFKALAEEKRAQVDRLLARALHLRRLAASRMHDEDATKKLFDDIAPAYADRKGGYTRVLKTGVRRLGDGTLKAMLAFTPA